MNCLKVILHAEIVVSYICWLIILLSLMVFLRGGQVLPKDFDAEALMAELEEVKVTVKTQGLRITELESRIAALEKAESDQVDDAAAKEEDD